MRLISSALLCRTFRSGPYIFTAKRALEAGERFVHGVFGGLRVVEDDAGKCFELLLDVRGQFGLVVNRSGLPGGVVVRLQTYIELVIEETGGSVPSSGRPSSEPTSVTMGYFSRMLRTCGENGSPLKRNRIGHGGANPQRSFVEVGHKLAADEWNEQERGEQK